MTLNLNPNLPYSKPARGAVECICAPLCMLLLFARVLCCDTCMDVTAW